MNGTQSVDAPWGVSVFGAASVDAAPDLARLRVAIERTRNKPGEAFAATRGGVNRIREVLRGHRIPDTAVSTSRSPWTYGSGRMFLGYECTASFVIELRDPDIPQTVLVDVVEAGANQVRGVEFDVRTRKELRAQARTAAVAAAPEKAALYAAAAEVRLGPVAHIKDADSEQLQSSRGRSRNSGSGEGDLTPGKVTVSAGVVIGLSLTGS